MKTVRLIYNILLGKHCNRCNEMTLKISDTPWGPLCEKHEKEADDNEWCLPEDF